MAGGDDELSAGRLGFGSQGSRVEVTPCSSRGGATDGCTFDMPWEEERPHCVSLQPGPLGLKGCGVGYDGGDIGTQIQWHGVWASANLECRGRMPTPFSN